MCEDRVLDGPASEDTGPYALTPKTVELIPTLGAHFSRGGPVQDPVLTFGVPHAQAGFGAISTQGNRLQNGKSSYVRTVSGRARLGREHKSFM